MKVDSAVKHTPGPWALTELRPDCRLRIFEIPRGRTLASVYVPKYTTNPVDVEEANANARLIKAAPDLLEALEAIDAAIHLEALANRFPAAEEPVRKIKVAIRLAKGESL